MSVNIRAMAFLTRSVRQDSRLLSHHFLRAALAVVILYSFLSQYQTAASRGGAGAAFSSSVVNGCYWFLTLLGGIHFSSAIAEEKEEQTLPLLRMTGASSFSILAGKSLPRLAVAVLFVVVMAPFLLLAITLGGVLRAGLASAILSLLCYGFMLCQLGLFASVVASTARRAFSLTCFLWLLFELPHWWSGLLIRSTGMPSPQSWLYGVFEWLSAVGQYSLFANLEGTLLAFNPSDIWYAHMTWELVVGGTFFLLSWIVFEPFTQRSLSGDSGETTKKKKTSFTTQIRPWGNPVSWKSCHFLTGGFRWILIRIFVAPALIYASGLIVFGAYAAATGFEWIALAIWGINIGLAFWVITMSRLLGRVFNEEIHDGTLASLVMLPQKESSTYWSLVRGTLPAIAASATTAIVSFTIAFFWLLGSINNRRIGDIMEMIMSPWLWHFFSWILLTLHFGVLLSTYVRYGGMLLSVATCWFGLPILCTLPLGVMFSGSAGSGAEILLYIIPCGLIGLELAACIWIQRLLNRRLLELAAK